MALKFSRAQVRAYRMAAHGLDRHDTSPNALAVLDLGVQEVRGSASLAIAARLAEPLIAAELLPTEGPLTPVWSFRGAPHVHRFIDLPRLATALWPRAEADAMARLGVERKALKAAGIAGLDAFTAASEAMRAVVSKPVPKGEASAGMTELLPAAYSYRCRTCASTHIYGGLFQLVGLLSGTRLLPHSAPLTLAPLRNRPAVPAASIGMEEVAHTYLRLHGPATVAEVAGYLGTSQAQTRPSWPSSGLTEVTVDGRTAWLPDERIDALRQAPPAPFVRLLPPLDPYLQARDREVIVPDEAHRKALWRILGNPGVLLVRGDVAGTWRARATGKKRMEITVQSLGDMSRQVRKAVDDEAARIATVRGLPEATVGYE